MVGRPFIASLDMYRKVPVDLLEGTRRGSILSTVAVVSMATLFFLETKAFLSSSLKTSLALDGNTDPQVRVNFNITMMDLKCDFATIDVVSVLGTQQNVTQHVQKFPIDQYGVRQRYQQRNRQQHDVQLFDATIEETIEELHENGEHAQSLDADLLEEVLEYNTYAFIDFFANWCSHCRDLAPTWETLAEVMHQVAEERVESAHEAKHGHREHHYSDEDYAEAVAVELPVFIGKIDCVEHQELCMQRSIRAYPTLKFFVDGVEKGDYLGHRTVVELAHFIESMELEHKGKDAKDDLKSSDVKNVASGLLQTEEHLAYARSLEAGRRNIKHAWKDDDHPGCLLSGFLLVDRAPGNFHIQAQSKHHDLAAHMTNVSHIINHLSFGTPFSQYFISQGLKNTPPGFLESTRPFDGNVYVTQNVHEAHHHYLKVITTEFESAKTSVMENKKKKKKKNKRAKLEEESEPSRAYQILQSSQLSLYKADIVPEAKFTYDLSPIAVSYSKKYRAWYDYFTSVMAIIGGTFTVVGMLESGIHTISSKKRR